jgi:HSP20 family protein
VAQLPWKSFSLLIDLDRQIDRVFEELIHKPWGAAPSATSWWPAVDIYESEEEYLVVADVPGVAPTELQVTVEDNELVICGKREVRSETYWGHSVRIERERGEFCRRVGLECPVRRDQVESRFQDGQLIVRLTKRSQSSQARFNE